MASYGTDEGFADWLQENGHSLPLGGPQQGGEYVDVPSLAALRARGSAYVDGYDRYWTGTRTGGVAQDLAWPRTGATLNCTVAVPADVVPSAVTAAAYRAAWLEAVTPGILGGSAPLPGARVKRQKVDVIEREFFDDGKAQIGAGPTFVDSTIDGLLSAFICDHQGGAFMWSLGS